MLLSVATVIEKKKYKFDMLNTFMPVCNSTSVEDQKKHIAVATFSCDSKTLVAVNKERSVYPLNIELLWDLNNSEEVSTDEILRFFVIFLPLILVFDTILSLWGIYTLCLRH